jgi:DNA transformation protein
MNRNSESMKEIKELPNIGKKLAEELQKTGITSYEQLVKCGSVEALLKMKGSSGEGCYNMLYALEGAIQGIRWHKLPKEKLENLKQEYLKKVKTK